MKKVFIILVAIGVLLVSCKTKKIPVGTSTNSPNVYVAGYIEIQEEEDVEALYTSVFTGRDTMVVIRGKSQYYATIWKNGVKQILSDGTNHARALSVFVSGDDVYVTGYDGNVATVWKNGVQQNLTDGTYQARAHSVYVSNSDVYIAGCYEDIDNVVAKIWKNGEVFNLSDGTLFARAYSVFATDFDVYVAGQDRFGKLWKNSIGQNLDGIPFSVFVSENDVYLAGNGSNRFEFEDRFFILPYALLWKNGVAQRLTDHDISRRSFSNREEIFDLEISSAKSVFVADNDVYVLGSIGKLGSNENSDIILWKNGVAQKLTKGFHGDGSVFVHNNNVYVTIGQEFFINGVAQKLDIDQATRSFEVLSVFVK